MIDIRTIKNGYWWDSVGKFDALVNGENSLRELTMQITDRCNMNCIKCNKRNFTYDDMKSEDVVRIIYEACDLGLKHIHFTGGEPTMHADYVNFVRLCRTKGLRIDMSTNGMFDAEKAKALVDAGIDSINISWDYIEQEPDCMKFIGGFPIKVFLNHMVIPSNYRQLGDFLEHVMKIPFVVDIQLMPPRGDARKFTREQIAEFNNSVDRCYEISRNRYPMVAYKLKSILGDVDADKGIYHDRISWPCHRSKTELRVGVKGFTTCTYLYRDGHVTCGLENSVEDAWKECMIECKSSNPPIKSMCDFSCSPEVCYFNYFVEEQMPL